MTISALLAASANEPIIHVWDLLTGQEACQLRGHQGNITSLAFTTDGRLLAVQDSSRMFRLEETETGRTVARFESPDLCEAWEAVFTQFRGCAP